MFYTVLSDVCISAAEFENGKFVALHRETTQPLFLEYAAIFTRNHKGESFDEIKSALALNGDTLTEEEIIVIPLWEIN